MSPEVRAAIEARLERCQWGMGVVPAGDVAYLLLEVDRLGADRERLRAALRERANHHRDCRAHYWHEANVRTVTGITETCICGLSDLLGEAPGALRETEPGVTP